MQSRLASLVLGSASLSLSLSLSSGIGESRLGKVTTKPCAAQQRPPGRPDTRMDSADWLIAPSPTYANSRKLVRANLTGRHSFGIP